MGAGQAQPRHRSAQAGRCRGVPRPRRQSDAIVEAMRPGALDAEGRLRTGARGQPPHRCGARSPATAPPAPPRHAEPRHRLTTCGRHRAAAEDEDGFSLHSEHASVGIHAGRCTALWRWLRCHPGARHRQGCTLRSASRTRPPRWTGPHRGLPRPRTAGSEVTGNASDNYERRPPGTAGYERGRALQHLQSSDGHVLFMASERKFWRTSAVAVGRPELFEQNRGAEFAGPRPRQPGPAGRTSRHSSGRRPAPNGSSSAGRSETPRSARQTPPRPSPTTRSSPRECVDVAGRPRRRQMPFPVRVDGSFRRRPRKAPTPGEQTDDVLRDVLGYDESRRKELREAGVNRPEARATPLVDYIQIDDRGRVSGMDGYGAARRQGCDRHRCCTVSPRSRA